MTPVEVMKTEWLNRGTPGEGIQKISSRYQHIAAYLLCDIGQAAWLFWASVSLLEMKQRYDLPPVFLSHLMVEITSSLEYALIIRVKAPLGYSGGNGNRGSA